LAKGSGIAKPHVIQQYCCGVTIIFDSWSPLQPRFFTEYDQ